jgi:hypothetical protein
MTLQASLLHRHSADAPHLIYSMPYVIYSSFLAAAPRSFLDRWSLPYLGNI